MDEVKESRRLSYDDRLVRQEVVSDFDVEVRKDRHYLSHLEQFVGREIKNDIAFECKECPHAQIDTQRMSDHIRGETTIRASARCALKVCTYDIKRLSSAVVGSAWDASLPSSPIDWSGVMLGRASPDDAEVFVFDTSESARTTTRRIDPTTIYQADFGEAERAEKEMARRRRDEKLAKERKQREEEQARVADFKGTW